MHHFLLIIKQEENRSSSAVKMVDSVEISDSKDQSVTLLNEQNPSKKKTRGRPIVIQESSSKLRQTDNATGDGYIHVPSRDSAVPSSPRPITKNKKAIKREKRQIWKNVVVISLSFMCLFTAFLVTEVLQSSLNSEDGLGTFAQATIYLALIFSSMFLPSWIIQKIGLKWTMVISQLCYSTYTAAQFYPSFYTLIPAAILVGLGGAPLWAAKATYLTKAGARLNELMGNPESSAGSIIARFFGFFFMVFQTSAIWGNLLNSLILSQPKTSGNDTNDITIITDEQLSYCGVNFCNEYFTMDTTNESSSGPSIKPPKEQTDMLFGILLGFSLLAAVIIAIFLDPTERDATANSKGGNCNVLIATFRQMRNPYQILIIPLTMWIGFGIAFILADFSAAFIVCSWGVEQIGYVMVCLGVTTAVSSMLWGYLVKIIGRLPIFLIGAVIHFSLILTMLFFWNPDPRQAPELYFVVIGLWGVAHAVWDTQINALYGVIFNDNKEAAFSNFWLWMSLGFAIAFGYSTFLCIQVKLYILLGMLITGITGYLVIEFKEGKQA